MTPIPTSLTTISCLLLLAGCTGEITLPARDYSAVVQTGALAYEVEVTGDQGRMTLDLTYRNTSAEPRFLERCTDSDLAITLERKTSRGWSEAWVPSCPRMLLERFEVTPGESRTLAVDVVGVLEGDILPTHRPPAPGIYRATVFAYSAPYTDGNASDDPETLRPFEERVSNEFRITD